MSSETEQYTYLLNVVVTPQLFYELETIFQAVQF